MYINERIIQNSSTSSATGQFHSETEPQRKTAASKQRSNIEQSPSRSRGTQEYNPLYDAVESNPINSRQTQRTLDLNNVRTSSTGFSQSLTNNFESPYDKPRGFSSNEKTTEEKIIQSRSTSRSKPEPLPTTEFDQLMERFGGDTTNPNQSQENDSNRKKRRRRRLLNNFVDFLALVSTCLIFGLIYLLIKPVQRGFFCDDTSIQYPFRPDTVPMWLLGIYGGVGPVIIFFVVEMWAIPLFNCRKRVDSTRKRRINYLKTTVHTIALFLLGIAVCFLITEVGKRTIGRLRPYYLTVCNPVWSRLNCTKTVQTASGPVVIAQYITEHNCNTTATEGELQEARLSFPSGHSSYSTYAFMFLFVYFEARLVCTHVEFLRPFLQCLCVAVAFFTCLSRVTDYKHHATDVIGGALIGFCIAVFTALRVGTYLWNVEDFLHSEEEKGKTESGKDETIGLNFDKNSSTTRPRNNNNNGSRSNYDNVDLAQQKSPGRPGRSYEEANV